jgi:outer membrane immunogenic protein
MRKSVAISALVLLAGGAAAFAADLPVANAPMYRPAPVFTWTGFYLGVNAGVAWNNGGSITVVDPVLGPQSIGVGSRSGFIGGGQAGYNIQSGALVYGIETDIQGIATGSSVNWGPYGFLHVSTSGNGGWLGTTRGRVGYAIDRTLLYVTGGVAYGGFNSNPLNGSGNATSNVGYALGGGIEYAFSQNWTAKIEALYVNLNAGNRTDYVTSGGLVYTVTAKSGNGGGIVRAGVNYLF